MKKIVTLVCGVLLILVSTVSLMGCVVDNDEDIFKKDREKVISAIQNKDHEGLKRLFAPNKIAEIENFDSKIDKLFLCYEGEYVSVKGGGPATDTDSHDGRLQKAFRVICDITTTVDVYRLAYVWYVKDTADTGNIGIWKIIFCKKSDDSDLPYWGGGAIIPEITIGKPTE